MDQYMIREDKKGIRKFQKLFVEHYLELPENKNDNRFCHISVEEPLTSRKFVGTNVKKSFEATIKENTKIIENTIKRLKYCKKDLEIIFTLNQNQL